MSEQFKVGDKVKLTAEAMRVLDDLPRNHGGHDLVIRSLEQFYEMGGGVTAEFADCFTGQQGSCNVGWLELVPIPAPGDGSGLKGSWLDPLKAEKADLLSRISEIDKQIEAEAQGDGLSRLKAIVEGTGYFRVRNCFYCAGAPASIVETDIVGHYEIGIDGFCFDILGGIDGRPGQATAEVQDYLTCFPSDLEGWQSITMERFLRAKSDYEDIVGKVKEAMEP